MPAPDDREGPEGLVGPDDGDRADREPTFREALADAAQRSGLGQVAPGEAPSARALLGAMGGIRGLIESILPGVTFLVTFTATQGFLPRTEALWVSVAAPALVAILFVVVRAVQRQPVTTALAGLIGIALSAGLALWTGNASNNFVLGFVISAGTVVVLVASLIARWPLIGLVVGMLTGDPTGWRDDRAKVRVATIATILWAALSALRLAVQFPLYLADLPQALGATKLVMGVPLYAVALWVTWLLVRTAWTTARPSDEPGGIR